MRYNLNSVKYLNLACGENYINNNQWLNCDFIKNQGVKKIDLLGKLPLKSNSIEALKLIAKCFLVSRKMILRTLT